MLTKFEMEQQERHLAMLTRIANALEKQCGVGQENDGRAGTCPYCHNQKGSSYGRSLTDPGSLGDTSIRLYCSTKEYWISVSDKESSTESLNISYCPVCGRKLKED